MIIASVIVLVIVVALAALAVWRCHKKGAPCECGCTCPRSCIKYCGGCCRGRGGRVEK